MPLSDTQTRLSVQLPGALTDISVSHDLPMERVTAEIVVFLKKHFAQLAALKDADDSYKDILDYLSDPYETWQLVGVSGRHYPGEKKLRDTDLLDGSVVSLAKSNQRENYQPLIDDTGEAIAHYQRLHFGAWVSADARLMAGLLLPAAAFLVAGVLIWGVATEQLGMIGQYVSCGVMAFVAVACLVGAVIGRGGQVNDPELDRVAAGVIGTGYILITAAGMLAVPGQFGGYHLMLGAGLLALTGLVIITRAHTAVSEQDLRQVRSPEALNFAAVTAGVLVAVVIAVGVFSGAGGLATSLGLALAAMAFYLLAPKMALIVARFQMPFIPSRGETFLRDEQEDLATFTPDTRNSVISKVVNQEIQVRTAREAKVGMVWGSLLVALLGSAIVSGATLNDRVLQAFLFWTAITLALLFRGKSFEDALIQRSWIAAGFLVPAGFIISATITANGGDYIVNVIGVAALMAGTAIGAYAAVRVKLINSPVVTRMLELVEMICYATPVVLFIWILGLFAQVRGR